MFKLVTISLMMTLVVISIAANPHSEKTTTTADTTTAARVLVSPKTNFTLSSSNANGFKSNVILEVWSERMISGKLVDPAAAEGHRLLNEGGHAAPAEGAAVAPAMSYTYRVNGKLYINDQNLFKTGADGKVSYQVKVGFFDKTYTTMNGPLTNSSTPVIDWAILNYDSADKTGKGTWTCNDGWTDYSKPFAPKAFTIPKWKTAVSTDDQQDCVLVSSFNKRSIVDDSHLFLTAQFNRLFDTGDKDQDIKMWSGMPITIVTQVGNDLSVDGTTSPFKTFDYQFIDFAIYDHGEEHNSTQVTIIIFVLLLSSCCIIGGCWANDKRLAEAAAAAAKVNK